MDRRHNRGCERGRHGGWGTLALWAAALLGLGGCVSPQTRLQKADEPEQPPTYGVRTVGDVTTAFANAAPIPLSGVGLVTNLEGTGGDAPAGDFRKYLEGQLLAQKFEHVHELLKSPDTAMVYVSGLLPAGAHKDDKIDVDITLPPNSRVTSLRGGVLVKCYLFNYDNMLNLVPRLGANKLVRGHNLAIAEGPVLVGFGDEDEATRLRHGRIWSGARCLADHPLALVLAPKYSNWPVAKQITERINETFHVAPDGMENAVSYARPGASIHEPVLFLRVPPQYKNNVAHFLRLVRLIPVEHDPAKIGPYRERLRKELLDPAHTITAALRLEAMGSDATGLLKSGLQSEHPLVRFAAAEALAFLDCSACGEVLAELAENQPELRAYCLAALASLNESVSHVELEKLLGSGSTDTRYGAFRGLLVLDDQDPAVKGELLNNAVWLHRVAPHSSALVHLSAKQRPEVVEFGDDIRLLPPFEILAGDYTFVAGKADTCCTVSRFSVSKGIKRMQCGLSLDEVLHTVTALGGQYPDVFELVRQADRSRVLNCPVAINALPQAEQMDQLARTGKDLKDMPDEIRNARTELGGTPTLFETQSARTPGR